MGAVVREVDGQLVLDDPAALGMMRAVAEANCRSTLEMNADRVRHFSERMRQRGDSAADVVIVILSVDDRAGAMLADALMPGFDWSAIRERGEKPYARGLARREGIQEAVDQLDADVGAMMGDMADVVVVVVDHGICQVYEVGP